MRKNIFFLIPFIISCFIGCYYNETDSANNVNLSNENNKEKESVTLVLVDFTRSLDSTSIISVAQSAYGLTKNAPIGMKLIFYPIDNNLYSRPFFVYKKKTKPKNALEIELWEDNNSKQAQKIGNIINKMYHTNELNNTCIITGLKLTYNELKNIDPEKFDLRLVILSDMLECCPDFPCGEKIVNYQRLIQKIPEYGLSNYPLSKIVPIENVRVVISSSNIQTYNKINQSQIFNNYWAKIGNELGYDKPFTMSSSLPNW